MESWILNFSYKVGTAFYANVADFPNRCDVKIKFLFLK